MFESGSSLIDIYVFSWLPTQIILQYGPRAVAASQQELCGATSGAVNQPHRQL